MHTWKPMFIYAYKSVYMHICQHIWECISQRIPAVFFFVRCWPSWHMCIYGSIYQGIYACMSSYMHICKHIWECTCNHIWECVFGVLFVGYRSSVLKIRGRGKGRQSGVVNVWIEFIRSQDKFQAMGKIQVRRQIWGGG